MKGHIHCVSSMVFAIVEISISLDGIIVILFGNFHTDARGVGERVAGEIIEVGVGVGGGGGLKNSWCVGKNGISGCRRRCRRRCR